MDQLSYRIWDFRSERLDDASPEDLREAFVRDGVVVFPDFFREELPAVNRELEQHFAAETGDLQGTAAEQGCDVIPWNPVEDGNQLFLDLRDGERFRSATEAVLGEGFGAPASLVMFSVGGGRGQAWHQDCPAGDDRGYNLNRLIYTQDVRREDGAIVFVPGSHRWGRIPPGGHQDPMDGEVALEPSAGTLVFLHGHVFHRVTPNTGRRPRTSVNFRAYPRGVDPDVNCVGVYRNAEVNFCDKRKHHDGKPAMTPRTGEAQS